MNYGEFFRSIIRQCCEYADKNDIMINLFIEKVSNDIKTFSENWVTEKNPITEPQNSEIKRFVIFTNTVYKNEQDIPLIDLSKDGDNNVIQ